MKHGSESVEETQDHCHYIVPRKKRRCRMLIKPGRSYCGEHEHLLNESISNKSEKSEHLQDQQRIPCPLDPNHSCSKSRLDSHLLKCPSRPLEQPEYISKGANLPQDKNDIEGLTLSSVSDEQLLNVIERINNIYETEIEGTIHTEILKHEAIEKEMKQEHIGPAASKHLVQNSSLLGHLEQLRAFDVKEANFVEFGSGRGQMTYWIAKASEKDAGQKFILVDKASHRHKFDNKLKDDEELQVARIKADIQDLVIDKIPTIKSSQVSL